ncbi:MAG: YdcF family protein [Acidobacteria bacterium]|nr:YdcF family protein [Acidobacteriota bacterium]
MSRYRFLLAVILTIALSLLYVHCQVHRYDDRIITNINGLDTRDWPNPRVAVVFGASVYGNRELSPILADRVETAIELYRARKVDRILVSGDARHRSYNEPKAMYEYLISHSVAANDVIVDTSGRSTYETCLRAKEAFGLNRAVLVSQSFHLSRALYIANQLGLDAVGMAGDMRTGKMIDYQGLREWAAELKAYLNLHFIPPTASMEDGKVIQ